MASCADFAHILVIDFYNIPHKTALSSPFN